MASSQPLETVADQIRSERTNEQQPKKKNPKKLKKKKIALK